MVYVEELILWSAEELVLRSVDICGGVDIAEELILKIVLDVSVSDVLHQGEWNCGGVGNDVG